jgi:hypothetical protein
MTFVFHPEALFELESAADFFLLIAKSYALQQ